MKCIALFGLEAWRNALRSTCCQWMLESTNHIEGGINDSYHFPIAVK